MIWLQISLIDELKKVDECLVNLIILYFSLNFCFKFQVNPLIS